MAEKKHLETRSRLVQSVRRFFFERDYIEVETPVRIPAPIPETHIDPVESEDYCLHASPEICMKQLLAQGYDRIFQITKVFRKHERGRKHLPEFSLLEWYTINATYRDLMDQLEALFLEVSADMGRGQILRYADNSVNLKPPWDRISVKSAFDRYGSVSLDKALENDMFDEVMGLEIEPQLGFVKPVFLYDYPAEKASLARLKSDDPAYAERVELYITGLELANGFTELTDPVEQRRRFESEHKIRSDLGKKNYPLPDKFLELLPKMPASAGIAAGLDRIIMLFCNVKSIDEVVAFIPENL